MRPICCGDRRDAHEFLSASSEWIAIEGLNPVWLQSPVAPSVAGEIERVAIDIDKIAAVYGELEARFEAVSHCGVSWRMAGTDRAANFCKRFGKTS